MNEQDTLQQAMEIMARVTPLRRDCGRLCERCCCRGDENTGMLLFAGEEAFYRNLPGFRVHEQDGLHYAVCGGSCARETRPLSCRLYPMFPLLTEKGGRESLRVIFDPRGAQRCPIISEQIRPRRAFYEAVQLCGQILTADPAQYQVLKAASAQIQDILNLHELLCRQ